MGTRETEHKDIVRRFMGQAFNAGHLAIIDELVARDYVLHVAPEVRGPEGMKYFVTMYRTAFPDYACTIDDQIAEGDKVVTRWTARGTQQGELLGVPPTGKQMGSWSKPGSRRMCWACCSSLASSRQLQARSHRPVHERAQTGRRRRQEADGRVSDGDHDHGEQHHAWHRRRRSCR
jgi:predicted ester cyclase